MKLALISRDGVINTAKAGGITHRTHLSIIDDSIAAIVKLSAAGFTNIIVTHQPGISRGLFDLDELEAIHSEIIGRVEQAGGAIEAVFYCPHDEQDRCHCRPPETGLLDAIEMEFDCNTATSVFFFASEAEQTLSETKACRGFKCDEDNHLLMHVHQLLTEK